ncbi:MAG: metallopeptidase family protein [Clostridiales bacterium]|nr:metallopeptidase family protein [Clostridiales bacterium]
MLSFEEVGEILDAIAEEVPKEFYHGLNGGILLLPECKQNPDDSAYGLYIMGEYVRNHMGRYIVIYYGSFAEVYRYGGSPERIKEELRETLFHEFTHHVESLAGLRYLEIKDEVKLARLRSQRSYRLKRQ